MDKTSEQSNRYYYPTPPDWPASYYNLVEERCEHLEELNYSTLELLRDVIKEFRSPGLNPLLGGIIERLGSIIALMETELDSLQRLDEATDQT